jgi:hypothetical protein
MRLPTESRDRLQRVVLFSLVVLVEAAWVVALVYLMLHIL